MKLRLKWYIPLLLQLTCACYAQSSQPPATADEMQFLSFMLMNVGSVDHDPSAIAAYQNMLIKQFNLNSQESAFINAQGQALNTLLKQLRAQSQAIMSGKSSLSTVDAAALTALSNQRQQYVTTLANEILNAVRPETANRLRTPGHIMAAAGIHGQ